jgi:hypothetical protein
MYAASGTNANVVRQLLLATANVFARDQNGNAAIHYTARSGSPEILRLLLTAGADPNATNGAREQPIELASQNPQSETIIQILRTAGATGGTNSESSGSGSSGSSGGTGGTADSSGGGGSTGGTSGGGTDSAGDGSPVASVPRPPETRNILYSGQQMPRSTGSSVSFRGYDNSLPSSYDRQLRSRENPRQVVLFVDNWYPQRVEVFKILENGQPEPIGRPQPYTSLRIETRQANVFVVYGVDGTYFGDYTTVGTAEQRVRTESR